MKQVLILDNLFSLLLTRNFIEESSKLGIKIEINQSRKTENITRVADINFFSTDDIEYPDLTRLLAENPSSLWYYRRENFVDSRIISLQHRFSGEYSISNARHMINNSLKSLGGSLQ